MNPIKRPSDLIYCLVFLAFFVMNMPLQAQDLYSARGYWQESTKENFRKLKDKKVKGDSLTVNEKAYLSDYETYLANYFNRMPAEEKQRYEEMKSEWDQELIQQPAITNKPNENQSDDFEWRPRDRVKNGFYGFYYGLSLAAIAEADGGAAAGIPFVTAGLWQLGPVMFPKKYEGINYTVMRASNSGKMLGLIYGLGLGMAVGGDAEESYKAVLGLSSLGSIVLGEVAFHSQKKKQFSEGHIELMRHYGLLGPWVGLAISSAANNENINLAGLSLMGGGVVGLLAGNAQARQYDYTRGDVDFINSLTVIATGAGYTAVINALENNTNPRSGLILIPAVTSIGGTLIAQRMVRGVQLTKRQGSTLSLASGGAALAGLGILMIAETESPTAYVGVPTALALITHQALFNSYKRKNLEKKLSHAWSRNRSTVSLKVNPENYFFNKQLLSKPYPSFGGKQYVNSVIDLTFKF